MNWPRKDQKYKELLKQDLQVCGSGEEQRRLILHGIWLSSNTPTRYGIFSKMEP